MTLVKDMTQDEFEVLCKSVLSGIDCMPDVKYVPRSVEEIGKLFYERELQIRKKIDELYERLHECQYCRDLLWKEAP